VQSVRAREAARHLAEIAYRMRLREDQYRARAFTRAAMALVAASPEPDLKALHGREGLQSLEAVGPGIARVLDDLVENGRSGYLDRLREETEEPCRDPPPFSLDGYQGDLHSHTTWSDGKASLLEMALAARARGFGYLAITDHSPRITVVHGLDPDRLAAQRREIDAVAERVDGLAILRGIEVDINEDGSLDLPDETLATLDVVIASPHFGRRLDPGPQTERMLRAVEHPHVDIIGHPTGRRPGSRQGARYDFEAVFRTAAEHGVALEIDCDPARMDLSPELARLAASLGCRFSLDSDAHAPAEFLYVELGSWCAELAGLGQDRFLNWLPIDRLREALA
jgi:putative hydrolase